MIDNPNFGQLGFGGRWTSITDVYVFKRYDLDSQLSSYMGNLKLDVIGLILYVVQLHMHVIGERL